MNIVITLLFGLVIGSFLNAVIYRLHEGKSFLKGRSYCPHCKHPLAVRDLIPLASFFIQKGKCRYCGKKISWQYPLVELGTALIFLTIYLKIGFSLELLVYAIFSIFLIIIFVYDLKYYLILDKVSIPGIIIGFIGALLLGLSLTNLIIGGIIGLAFFLIQFVVSRGKWIGGGDLRLGLMCGFMVGWPKIIVLIFITYISGAIVSLALLLFKKKKWQDTVPLGVFLAFATLVVLLFGDEIVGWYFVG